MKIRSFDISAKSLASTAFIALIFAKIFLWSWDADWYTRFVIFSVPATQSYGGDARNIQLSAYCASLGYGYFEKSECYNKKEILSGEHAKSDVPIFNYPSIWPRLYGVFNQYSEEFFKAFWILNAGLLLLACIALALRFSYQLLPLVLFSPVTLLAIERGNVDAMTLFVVFAPLLLFRSNFARGLSMGVATTLKLFPLFGFLAFFRTKTRMPFFAFSKSFLLGVLIAAPLIFLSFSEVPHILQGTPKNFESSYGLLSLRELPFFADRLGVSILAIATYLLLLVGMLWVAFHHQKLTLSTKTFLHRLDETSLTVLFTSLWIYFGTFLVFTSWAYRLIFLIPAFLIVADRKTLIEKVLFWGIFTALWFPLLPKGRMMISPTAYVLAIPVAYLLLFSAKNHQAQESVA